MRRFLLSIFGATVSLWAAAETITLDIKDADAFANWTVIDANSDGTTWKYDSENAMYHAGNSANDWLVSPAVELSAGVTYDVSALLRVETSTPRYSFHDFTVYAGTAPEVEALNEEIVKVTRAEYSLDPKTYKGSFTPETDATYYFAVHCTSGGWNDDLYFHSFTLEDTDAGSGEVPTVSLPYSENFSTADHGYTFFHVNSESRDWDISSQRLRYYGKNYYTSDAYAVTPAFRFEAGKNYELTFSTWINSASTSNYKPLTVKIGQGKDAASLNTDLFNETVKSSSQTKKTVNFSVEADGVYYLAFYCGGDVNANDIFVDDVAVKELLTTPQPATSLIVTAAAEGALEAVVSWTNPTKTNTNESLEEITKAVVWRDGTEIATITEDLVPGAKSEYTDAEVPSAGKHEYSVVLYLGENASEAAKTTSPWIGKDTSVGNVTNVKAETIDDHTVNLTFEPVTTGTNGGYVDPADIAYRIDRKAGSSSAVTIEEAWAGELPYVDTEIPSLNSYTYTVYTIYQGQNVTSTWAPPTSNTVTAGGSLDIPYSQDFTDTTNHFFKFFHGDGSTRDWTVSSSKYLSYWGNPADAYAVTPGLNLEAGKAYELTFSTWRSGTAKPLYVRLGKEASAEGLDTELFHEDIDNGTTTTKTVTFSVPENGVYYLAFHCFGTVDGYNNLYVDNIKVEEIAVSPLPVTDFTATAAEKGALQAVITWTNPTDNNAGGKLNEITKAVIARGTTEIATIEEGLTPGEEFTFTDTTIEEPGKYTYGVTVYAGENASEATTATTSWVGIDTPKPVENATATVNDEKTVVTVSWDAVSAEGVNGGYVDTEAITYDVVRMPESILVAEGISLNSVSDNVSELPLGIYWYEISLAEYPAVEASLTGKITLGAAIEVTKAEPYQPDFSNADTFGLWTLTNGGEGTGSWKYNEKDQTLETGFISNKPWALTPPLKLKEGKYKVVYKATCYSARYTSNMEIYLTDAPTHGADFKQLIHSAKVESVSWPSAVEVEFDVPADGTYHLGYVDTTSDHWKLALSQADVYLVKLAVISSPYVFDFSDPSASEDWVLDEEDGNAWALDSDNGALVAENGSPWAVTPAFDAAPGNYKLTYTASNNSDKASDGFEIYLLVEPKADAETDSKALAVGSESGTRVHVSSLGIAEKDVELQLSVNDFGRYRIGFKRIGEDNVAVNLKAHALSPIIVGVDDTIIDQEAIRYDNATNSITANGTLYIYNINGTLIGLSAEGVFKVDSLTGGVYIARCGDATFKFVK